MHRKNNNISLFYISLLSFHPHARTTPVRTRVIGETVKGETCPPDAPRRSRHVGAGWAISCVVEQGYGPTRHAAQVAHLPTSSGSFRAAGAVTAAGTVAVLHTVCFACPVLHEPQMEVHHAG
jgi:hypothetical protein